MEKDIFCKIIGKEIKGDIIYEDDDIVAFRDIRPQAPTHVLIVPRKHIAGVESLEVSDTAIAGKLIYAAKVIASQLQLADGYRLIINQGEDGGQAIPHLHLHLLGGKRLGPKIVN